MKPFVGLRQMFNLYTSYFKANSKSRQNEIDECLNRNIKIDVIKNVYLLLEEPIDLTLLPNSDKITCIYIKSRPLYNTFFEIAKMYSGENDWNIISNSDIYFDATLKLVNKYITPRPSCLALTRWEITADKIFFLNRPDSQDSWIFKGKPKVIKGDFNLGQPGCDNAISERFYRAGYNVINPSKTIKTYHLHSSQERTYNVSNKVPQPYKLLTPTV